MGTQGEIKLPGDRGGTSGPSKIKVFAAVPHDGSDGMLLSWEEEKSMFGGYVEDIMSMSICDYGLWEPPAPGVWVFEGELKITSYRSNHPEDPEEWDSSEHWTGEWRPPNVEELRAWGKRRPKLVGKVGPAPIEPVEPAPKPTLQTYADPPRRSSEWCDCGKHVSECCCGESHGSNHHPSGRAYDEEDYEQFYK